MTSPTILAPVERTYAIGDIHGCRVQFEAMLRAIETHAAGRTHRIITLGDYCDRGPDSRGVYEILMGRKDIIALRGNHEDMFLEARRGNYSELNFWMTNGGSATLRSFETADVSKIPDWYTDFIETLPWYFEDDLRVFVHAGIDPHQRDMSRQNPTILIWIRHEFLRLRTQFFKYVVHGHTPQINGVADIRSNRANLDTCCFKTGLLTCAIFGNEIAAPIGVIQVDEDGEAHVSD